jgi:hypothetical protein
MGFDGLPSNSIWWQTWQNHLSTDATESGQRLARQNVEVDNASEGHLFSLTASQSTGWQSLSSQWSDASGTSILDSRYQ